MTKEEYLQVIKDKKSAHQSFGGGSIYNFPGGPIGARLTGSIVYVLDSRPIIEPTAGLEAYKYEITINGSDFPDLERVSWPPPTIEYVFNVTENVFYLSHVPNKPWLINGTDNFNGLIESTQSVGSIVSTKYVRETEEDPWTVDEETTEDFTAQMRMLSFGGGHPVSGGRGEDSTEKKITLLVAIDSDEAIPPLSLGSFGGYVEDESELPYPWDTAWPSVSSVFTASFDADIASVEDYYDTTGSSCNMTFEWIY